MTHDVGFSDVAVVVFDLRFCGASGQIRLRTVFQSVNPKPEVSTYHIIRLYVVAVGLAPPPPQRCCLCRPTSFHYDPSLMPPFHQKSKPGQLLCNASSLHAWCVSI